MTLGQYLKTPAGREWRWGVHDCCTWVAGWVMLQGQRDPMAFIRGTYDSELGALRRIEEGGGLAALWARGMCEAGVPETAEPRAGDVGVIPTLEEGAPAVAAICLGDGRWAARARNGLLVEPSPFLRAWRIG